MQAGAHQTWAHALAQQSTAVVELPAARIAQRRLLEALQTSNGSRRDAILATEASVPLTVAVLRAANRRRDHRGTIGSVPAALAALDRGTVAAAVDSVPVFDAVEDAPEWGSLPSRLRMHAMAVRRVTEGVAAETVGDDVTDELRAAAILHDIGKPLLVRVYPQVASGVYEESITPEQEVLRERELMGVDHAAAGAWLLRRWTFPERFAACIEAHHDPHSGLYPSIIRVADMLVHYGEGRPVALEGLVSASEEIGLTRETLGQLMYELPEGLYGSTALLREPCPLSERELDVLRLLATGRVYKQIAQELDLAPSTVRSHLHRAYGRMGVADRTQAVLMATERGWL